MADKFKDTEKKIAQAENILLSNGKYVTVEYEEDHPLHLEIHIADKNNNMMLKMHVKNHIERQEMIAKRKVESMDAEIAYR